MDDGLRSVGLGVGFNAGDAARRLSWWCRLLSTTITCPSNEDADQGEHPGAQRPGPARRHFPYSKTTVSLHFSRYERETGPRLRKLMDSIIYKVEASEAGNALR